MPGMSFVRYVREGDHVRAEYHAWAIWDGPGGVAMPAKVTYTRELSWRKLYREHVGPTIRTTTRMQLIADGLLKPADRRAYRKSLKSLQESKHVGP